MSLKLNSDAIFIADSHFSPTHAKGFLDYLQSLTTPPSQMVLMGDIAQMLLGNLKSSITSNHALLSSLDKLEKKGTQIIWLEGNHDFFLSSIKKFKLLEKTLFIPRKKQPLLATYKGETYSLAHGDLFLNRSYDFYIRALTSIPRLLWCVDYLSGGEIYHEIEKKIECKPIARHDFHFFEFASKRIEAYQKHIQTPLKGIIEGHFHIGKKLDIYGITYVALPSFYFDPKGIQIGSIIK